MTRKASRKKRQQKAARPGGCRAPRYATSWIAMGALVASTTFGARHTHARELDALLRASDERRATNVARRVQPNASASGDGRLQPSRHMDGATRDEPVRRFDIAGDALDVVLAAFTQATGISVQLPAVAGVGSIYSPGVSGTFTIRRALDAILAGTSLSVRTIDADRATIEFRAASTSVDVTARAPVNISPKYTAPLVDTPPAIGFDTARVAGAVDLCLVPLRPSLLDIYAVTGTADVVKAAKTAGLLVLNAVPAPRGVGEASTTIDARKALAGAPLPVAEVSLGARLDYSRALNSGEAVNEFIGDVFDDDGATGRRAALTS